MLLGLIGIGCAVPLLWLLLAPTKTDAQLANDHPLSFGSLSGYAVAWGNVATFNDGVIY